MAEALLDTKTLHSLASQGKPLGLGKVPLKFSVLVEPVGDEGHLFKSKCLNECQHKSCLALACLKGRSL